MHPPRIDRGTLRIQSVFRTPRMHRGQTFVASKATRHLQEFLIRDAFLFVRPVEQDGYEPPLFPPLRGHLCSWVIARNASAIQQRAFPRQWSLGCLLSKLVQSLLDWSQKPNKIILWYKRWDLNPHDLAVGGF